jgi:hypothetical protein
MLSNLTPTQIRLYEKQQEHASLQALKEASGQMLERVEELARMSHVMADGGAGECLLGAETNVDIWVSGGVLIRVCLGCLACDSGRLGIEELEPGVFHPQFVR